MNQHSMAAVNEVNTKVHAFSEDITNHVVNGDNLDLDTGLSNDCYLNVSEGQCLRIQTARRGVGRW